MYLSRNIYYEIIFRNIIFKELIWFKGTSIITEENIKPDKTELEKDYDNATQNDEDDEEEYHPVPCEITESKMMFVYQSNEMQRLYRRYAPTLLLLDVTYQTTKYSLPLYFLVVHTNANYQVAAVIVCQEETTEMITKAFFSNKRYSCLTAILVISIWLIQVSFWKY